MPPSFLPNSSSFSFPFLLSCLAPANERTTHLAQTLGHLTRACASAVMLGSAFGGCLMLSLYAAQSAYYYRSAWPPTHWTRLILVVSTNPASQRHTVGLTSRPSVAGRCRTSPTPGRSSPRPAYASWTLGTTPRLKTLVPRGGRLPSSPLLHLLSHQQALTCPAAGSSPWASPSLARSYSCSPRLS